VSEKRIGVIMHGVTGRMGMNQHLIRSILEIRRQGGVALKDGTRVTPDPLLVGRNAERCALTDFSRFTSHPVITRSALILRL